MKNIAKYTIIAAVTMISLNAEAKSKQEMIAEDAAKDPYALQYQVYQSNEHGLAAKQPKPNVFKLEDTTTTTHEEPAPMKVDLEKVDEGYNYQKYQAMEKKGVERVPTHRKNNAQVPTPEYSIW